VLEGDGAPRIPATGSSATATVAPTRRARHVRLVRRAASARDGPNLLGVSRLRLRRRLRLRLFVLVSTCASTLRAYVPCQPGASSTADDAH